MWNELLLPRRHCSQPQIRPKRTSGLEEITSDEGALYALLADLRAAGVESSVIQGLEADVKRLTRQSDWRSTPW